MEFSTINLRRWFLFLFALALLGVNATIFVFYNKNEELSLSHQWVAHTYKVLAMTNDMFTNLVDAQTAQRGYLITTDPQFLNSYQKSMAESATLFRSLTVLTSDNFKRQTQLLTFGDEVKKQSSVLENENAEKRSGRPITVAEMLANKKLLDQVRIVYHAMLDDETTLLTLRLASERQKQSDYVHGIFLASGASILGLLLANGLIVFLSLRQKAAEQNLLRINKEMEGFTYIASHDLRSPLVNLKGFASEMKYGLDELQPIVDRAMEGAPEADRKKALEVLHQDIPEALGYIHSSVEKMDKLTNAILELSRIGRRNMKMETLDVNQIVSHVLDTLHHQIETHKIQTRINHLPSVYADPLSIEQIFGNVIDNAIKYLDPQRAGRIEIGGSKNFRETTYWVKDNGRGISHYDQQKIFEIYRRGGGVQDVAGEGMGMAYVRATLRRLDGTIWFESTPGEGTTFFFTISNTLTKKEA